ncbi:unnamed protein product [Anisakis simplex]|uniref:Metalloproteinase n=1 Tax=Anisakis simplex TaxID=6269 RepID=A0A0M3K265_ANISI|nr:unnamed protein product [Anisakis simplex]
MKSLLLITLLAMFLCVVIHALNPYHVHSTYEKRLYDDLYRNALNYGRRMDELDGTLDLQKIYQNFAN